MAMSSLMHPSYSDLKMWLDCSKNVHILMENKIHSILFWKDSYMDENKLLKIKDCLNISY